MQPAVIQRNRFRRNILASTATSSQEPLIHGVSSGPPAGPADARQRRRPSYAALTPAAECCI
jgi:hypothetical protein